MKKLAVAVAGIAAAGAAMGVALASGAAGHGGGAKIVRSNPNSATPVVVELFTSEGCSDCPAADAVLANLTKRQPLSDVHVIALGEHVDYWNNRSWKDPFSTAAFLAATERVCDRIPQRAGLHAADGGRWQGGVRRQ